MIPSFFSRLQLPSGPPTVCVIAGDDAAPLAGPSYGISVGAKKRM